MDLKNLLKMDYMTVALQTVVLVVWVIFVFPILVGMAGYPFDILDPLMAGTAFFTGLMVSVVTFKLVKYRKGY